jgi:PTS system mannitol-specific IIC component
VASPGSILNIILLSKEKDINTTLLGFLSSTLVSFITTYMILKCSKRKITLEKIEDSSINLNDIKKIVFMCDAGMGSSAIGANMLRNILKNTKYKNIEITNTYIGDKLDSSDTIVTHEKLKSPVKNRYSNNSIVFLQDFLDKDFYIEKFLKEEFIEIYTELSLKSTSKEKALEKLGEDIESLDLAEKGYKESILERERSCSTFLGNGVAIPHGLHSSLKLLKKNAVIIHHYPYGIDFGEDEKVYILVGLLIKDQNLRVEYLSNIVKNIENEELMEALTLSDDKGEFIEAFNGGMYVK